MESNSKLISSISICIILTEICQISCNQTTIGEFLVIHEHAMLTACARHVLSKNEFAGGRVSKLTGECQGLSQDWAINPTIESGYCYAKKILVKEDFEPPISVTVQKPYGGLAIPVAFIEGTKIEMSLTMPASPWDHYFLTLQGTTNIPEEIQNFVQMSINPVDNWIKDMAAGTDPELVTTQPNFATGTTYNMTLEAHTDSIKFLVNGDEIHEISPHSAAVNTVRLVLFTGLSLSDDPLLIHSFTFSGAEI